MHFIVISLYSRQIALISGLETQKKQFKTLECHLIKRYNYKVNLYKDKY